MKQTDDELIGTLDNLAKMNNSLETNLFDLLVNVNFWDDVDELQRRRIVRHIHRNYNPYNIPQTTY